MGVPKYPGLSMNQHPQYVTVRYMLNFQLMFSPCAASKFCPISVINGRNERGREMLDLVKDLLEVTPTISRVRERSFLEIGQLFSPCPRSHPSIFAG